jgi:hypothetical protein
MKIVKCDACGKDITELNQNKFEYKKHLDSPDISLNSHVDRDGNRTSGVSICKEVCNKCYNKIMQPAVKVFKESGW